MGEYFDDIHALAGSQLDGRDCEIGDTSEIALLREKPEDIDSLNRLYSELKRCLRYREAAEVCTKIIALSPKDATAYRRRAGMYLSTLQPDRAVWDFLKCITMGLDKQDIYYRLGMCRYFQGDYLKSTVHFEDTFYISGDEMGIAAMYWHTLSAARGGMYPLLLTYYHTGMDVGHHTAYEKAMSVWAGKRSMEDVLSELEGESEDLEYVIAVYGLAVYFETHGDICRYNQLMGVILKRNGFWPCFSYLAAYNDVKTKGDNNE